MRMIIRKKWLILICTLPYAALADLFVLRAGYGFVAPAVLRYREEDGAFIDHFNRSTNYVPTGETQEGMCFGPDGNLYTTGNNLGSGVVNCFDGVSGQLRHILYPSNLFAPTGLRFGNSGQLYVCGYTNLSIFGGQDRPALFVLNATNGARIAVFRMPSPLYDVTVSKTGLVLANDWSGSRILRINGSTFSTADSPKGLTFGPDGHLYVSSHAGNSVLKIDGTNGTLLSTFIPSDSGGLVRPTALTFGPDGHLYVSSSPTNAVANNAVFRYNGSTGAFMGQFVTPGSGGANTIAMIEFADMPRLRIRRAGTNVLLAWPAALTNFTLETSSIVSTSNAWVAMTNTIGVIGRERVVTNNPAGSSFYRLRK